MVIMTRTFELLDWVLPKSERFPRAYRFTLTQRIMNLALDLQECLVEAQATSGAARARALQRADVALQSLRVYLRLVNRWAWLKDGQYEHVSRIIAEIGRMLGGWRRRVEGDGR
jgi:23S rRNA-intervening sequence protein